TKLASNSKICLPLPPEWWNLRCVPPLPGCTPHSISSPFLCLSSQISSCWIFADSLASIAVCAANSPSPWPEPKEPSQPPPQMLSDLNMPRCLV
ncbi:mCG145541, partial [Mus musculus]